MQVVSISLCPASLATLPELGRSAYVRRALLAYATFVNPSGGNPASGGQELIKQEAAPAANAETSEVKTVVWERIPGAKPYYPDYSRAIKAVWKKGVCVSAAPLYEFPDLHAQHGSHWGDYCRAWEWPDPFPGIREWMALGQPRTPSEEHRDPRYMEPVAVEPVAVEPVAVEPVAVDSPLPVIVGSPLPVIVEPVIVDSPLQGAGMSSNVLDDI
jgi:hypothetical protein